MQVPLVGQPKPPHPTDGSSLVSPLQEQQLQEQLFLERLTLRLQQMGPPSSSTQQDCIRKLKSLNLDDHFWMYIFKVAPCTRTYAHKWTLCPCAHAGETARRRDPRTSSYKAVLCPLVKAKKVCPLGDACSYSHNVFEHWLHPSRYKTRLCSFGSSCNRSICFFAHATEELRCVPNMDENKEVDEREFLMQLMVAQESGLLPQDALHQQPQPPPVPQQVQLPHQHPHSPLPSQQLPVLYTMAPDALQQPVQQVLTRTSTTGSASNMGAPALRRPGPARSLTGIPSSYTLPTQSATMPQLHSQPAAAASAYCPPPPPRLHPHSFNGSFSSAPNATVAPVGDDTRYLSMASLQETLAGLGLGPNGPISSGADEDAASCDDMFPVGDGSASAASMVHGFRSVPRPQRPGGSSFFARAMGQRISDPGMHALFHTGPNGGGGASSDEDSSENLSTMNRISDSGKPLGFVLPLMNYAQQQQQVHAQATLQEQLAAVQQHVSTNVGGGSTVSAPTLVQGATPTATFPIMRHHRGSSNSPHSSSVTSGSPRSSSPPTSWDTNCSASQLHFHHHMAPHSPASAPAVTGASVQPQQPQQPQQQQQQQQQEAALLNKAAAGSAMLAQVGAKGMLQPDELRAFVASTGIGAGSPSYVDKFMAELEREGGSKEQLVASLSQMLAKLLSAP